MQQLQGDVLAALPLAMYFEPVRLRSTKSKLFFRAFEQPRLSEEVLARLKPLMTRCEDGLRNRIARGARGPDAFVVVEQPFLRPAGLEALSVLASTATDRAVAASKKLRKGMLPARPRLPSIPNPPEAGQRQSSVPQAAHFVGIAGLALELRLCRRYWQWPVEIRCVPYHILDGTGEHQRGVSEFEWTDCIDGAGGAGAAAQ